VFCNVCGLTLSDRVLPDFLDFMDANRALSGALILGVQQKDLSRLRADRARSLAALAERGFRSPWIMSPTCHGPKGGIGRIAGSAS